MTAIWPIRAIHGRLLTADSVEKVLSRFLPMKERDRGLNLECSEEKAALVFT